jgi:lipoprotein-anchoring transpeptidase ErfK/SrfK
MWFNSGPLRRTIAALLAAAGLACAAAPAAEQLQAIAPGVSVLGVHLGGLTALRADRSVALFFTRPIVIADGARRYSVSPAQLGAHANVEAAVRAALAATPESRIGLPVGFSHQAVSKLVDRLARVAYRAPRNASVVGAGPTGRPAITPDLPGIAVQKDAMSAAIAQEFRTGSRATLPLLTTPVRAKVTVAGIGAVIIVNRAENKLELFDSRRLVRTFPVATGQAIYPTPQGVFKIVEKELNPWWYPPVYDAWARGLKPVPPGPGNPLGTRWMGLSAPGVGIHGTDADTSIGYSLSHGCIRMHVPDAEWLFRRVVVGTPVVIV